MGPSQTKDQICVPCIGRQILNYWVTREVQCRILEALFTHSVRTTTYTLELLTRASGIDWGRRFEQYMWEVGWIMDFSGGANDKESACQCRSWKRRGFNPWIRKIPWRRNSLAWRIPWTEKSGRLQSMGSQRVRHDWARTWHPTPKMPMP